jgi:type IV pilus assembly protein PilQ
MISLRAVAAAVALSGAALPAAVGHTPAAEGTVLSLLLRPGSSSVDVLVGIRGQVTTSDFVLRRPDKIVVDIANASLGMASGKSYSNDANAGILNIRYAQFKPTVVRVVLTLDSPHPYTVSREADGIRISVSGIPTNLPAWAVGYRPASPGSAALPPRAAAGGATPAVPVSAASTHASPDNGSAPLDLTPPKRRGAIEVNGKEIEVAQQSQQRPITVNFENLPILDVLKIFSQYSGRSILPSASVKGTVSASINDVPWDVALRAILNLNGFDAREDPEYGFITVDTYESINKAAAAAPMQTATLTLNYANVQAIADMLRGRLSRDCGTTTLSPASSVGALDSSGVQMPPVQQPMTIVTTGNCPVRGAVTADTLSGTVSITDIPANLADLEQYARSLDRRQPQVNIKAKIILVDRTSLEGLGIRYDLGTQQQFFNDIVPRTDSSGAPLTTTGQILLGGNTIAAIANASARIPAAALQLAYSTALGAFDFTTFIEALQTTSLLDVQSEPNGTVMNNRTLILKAGSEIPIRTTEPGAGANAAGNQPTVTVRLRSTGVILQVTPRVTNDGRIQMRIHVENSDVTFSGSDAIAFPTQSVDNEVMLADGATWVIGGLTQTSVTSTRTGIPMLVDLPVIGRLFGMTQKQETKRDLLILITPHIVDPGQEAGSGH